MRQLIKYFFTGIVSLTPILLTITIFSWLFRVGDDLLGNYYRSLLGIDIPGLGLISIIIIVIAVGYFTTWYVGKALWNAIDQLFNRLPLIKSIYSILKETVGTLFGERKSFGQPVALRIPGSNLRVMGFITNADLTSLGFPDHVAVYVPQSLQWAGITFIISKQDLEFGEGGSSQLDLPTEEAMKFILSAGVATKNQPEEGNLSK
ncbi:MAG: DUF502 domain-containing protein [Carboxydocellales bacterium]